MPLNLAAGARRLGRGIARHPTLGRAFVSASSRSLRVLAFHGVPDPERFDAQMRWLVQHHEPVDAAAVLDAAHGASLPRRAVWVTFDDGCPDVVDHGLEVLGRYGISATLYVCPGLIEKDAPFWWDVVAATSTEDWLAVTGQPLADPATATAYLKTVPDPQRRRIVDALPYTRPTERLQLDEAQVERWLAAGHQLGNHTWDHPCLDQCSPEEQHHQIADAHAWLVDRVPGWVPLFAYPNGNWAVDTHAELVALGYATAVLHDHRRSSAHPDPLRISRLHVDAADPLDRFASVVDGVQPALRAATDRVAGRVGRARPASG